ncbi:MAG: hypothetical protein JF612_08345, partial [Planctomycetia bacterium]|nr:hypothetical protein [Planctomycetia bacterium]
NVRDEPIVCTPEDAYRCFQATSMDVLVLEDCIVESSPEAARIFPTGQRRVHAPRSFPPSMRQLREFAVIGALILAFLTIRELAVDSTAVGIILGVAATFLLLVGWRRPRWLALIFTTWMTITYPMAWLISSLLVAIVYYGLVTPVALVFRLLGRDVLQRSWRPGETSYWQEKPAAEDSRRYLQSF